MRALVTGASSGIGRECAKILALRGYELTLVARREDRLRQLAAALPTPCHILTADLSDAAECRLLYEAVRGDDLDVVVNNAGFGLYGAFCESNLDRELEMLDVNIRAVHILTKLFVRDFARKNHGYVLNVASSAGFLPGPLMATYYASKNYVLRLSQAVREELRRRGSAVQVAALCPGPVDTEFNRVAGVSFSVGQLSAPRVALEGINGMFAGRGVIVPGLGMKALLALSHFCPTELLPRITYCMQKAKNK